eukprot:6600122-Lingulodinium_polyedra.AAC.1
MPGADKLSRFLDVKNNEYPGLVLVFGVLLMPSPIVAFSAKPGGKRWTGAFYVRVASCERKQG